MKEKSLPSASQLSHTYPSDTFPGNALESGHPDRGVTILDRWLLQRIVESIGRPPVRMGLWDGQDIHVPPGPSAGRVQFNDRGTLFRLAIDPERAFGDAFVTGRIEIRGDLVRVLEAVFRSIDRRVGAARFKRTGLGRLHRAHYNDLRKARRNIHYHYDLGNDFYGLWLDENMAYTCAYYARPEMSLEEAQVAKMEHVCRKVGLRPGMKVVEAGCGWGTLAMHMARQHGVSVRAFNISHQQIAYARERAAREGLDGRVEFIEDDFRNISGQYDAFVSVGMLEHVGPASYEELGDVAHRSLQHGGLGIIHSVGRSRPVPPNAWIQERIFPGSYVPSLREMMAIFEPHGFSIIDVENLRIHYARTLMAWLDRFDAEFDRVRRQFDMAFIRAWRLYLGGCAAGFLADTMQLFQVVFAPRGSNAVPVNREHLYQGGAPRYWQAPGDEKL